MSRREEEVLTLLAKGKTNKEIADSLIVTESTAKAHLHNILKKIQARSRQQTVILARDKGVFSNPND